MKRLTTNNPKDNMETAFNLFYIKGHETWVRGGGPAPEYADISLFDFIRRAMASHIPDEEPPEDNDDLPMMMTEWLMDDIDTAEGILALLYTAAWTYAELRHRLAAYEDTGMEPEQVAGINDSLAQLVKVIGDSSLDRLRELAKADKDGRLVVFPCGINDTAWYADKDEDRVLMGYVSSYQILSDGAVYFEFTNVESDVEWVSVELPIEDFGKTAFLTREEAEKALASDTNVGHTIPVNDLYDEEGGDVRGGGTSDA